MGTADRESRLREREERGNSGELDVKPPPLFFFFSPSFQTRLHSTPPLFFSPLRQFPSPGRRRRVLGTWVAEEVTLLLYQIDQGRKRKGILPLGTRKKESEDYVTDKGE